MTNEQILSKLAETKKGRYIALTKVKDLGEGIIKESKMRIRLGVAYANMKLNEGKQTGELPWGHWVEGLENLVIEHKNNFYLRVSSTTPETPGNADVLSTRYLRNGAEISKDEVVALIGEKKLGGNASPVYNIKFENIVALGGEN